jgi:hypothetical protein
LPKQETVGAGVSVFVEKNLCRKVGPMVVMVVVAVT